MDRVAEIAGDLSQGGRMAGSGDLGSEFAGMASGIEEGGEAGASPLGEGGHQRGDRVGVGTVDLSELVAGNGAVVVEIFDADRTGLEHSGTCKLGCPISAMPWLTIGIQPRRLVEGR